MSMSDRINPGPGWRLLEVGEIRIDGDEFFRFGKWTKTSVPGAPILCGSYPTRRRIAEPRTVKGIATRATVRAVFESGTICETVVRNDSGLPSSQMDRAQAAYDQVVNAARNGWRVPKYIMLEIQRGPNDY